MPVVLPPVIVSPEIDAVTPAVDLEHPARLPPLTVTPAFGPVIVVRPGRVAQLELAEPIRVIICGVLKTLLSKAIVSLPPAALARPIS